MKTFALPYRYFIWHYTRALRDMSGIWINCMWFVGNLFSGKTLLITLLQPLQLIQEEKGNLIADPARFAQGLIVNIIMRIVGMFARLALLLIACVFWGILLIAGPVALALWLLIPVLLFVAFGIGITLLAS